MKPLALTVLGLACALTGRYIAYRMNMRVSRLEKVRLMLSVAEQSLCYLSSPADELMRSLSEKSELSELKFLRTCYAEMCGGEDFRTAWSGSVGERDNVRYLDRDDVSLLLSFGENFGTTDSDGQVANCKLHSSLVDDRLARARRKRDSCASLSCGMGVLCGIGLMIIFF